MQSITVSTTLVIIFSISLVQTQADPVIVPDQTLRSELLNILKRKGVEKEDLDSKDLETIYFIDGTKKGITDLSGLEHCMNLREIRLSHNQLVSIQPLTSCINVQMLDLSNNQITDISALKPLENLQYLNIERNAVQNIECVAGMKLLASFYASHNKLTSIAPVRNLTKLHSIYLADNDIEDISPLADLPQLASIDLQRNKVVDVHLLTKLKNLRWTFLAENNVTDITPLADMARADAVTRNEFAPYWRLFLQNNPLNSSSAQALQSLLESEVTVTTQSRAQIPQPQSAADKPTSPSIDVVNPQPTVKSPE